MQGNYIVASLVPRLLGEGGKESLVSIILQVYAFNFPTSGGKLDTCRILSVYVTFNPGSFQQNSKKHTKKVNHQRFLKL